MTLFFYKKEESSKTQVVLNRTCSFRVEGKNLLRRHE